MHRSGMHRSGLSRCRLSKISVGAGKRVCQQVELRLQQNSFASNNLLLLCRLFPLCHYVPTHLIPVYALVFFFSVWFLLLQKKLTRCALAYTASGLGHPLRD